MFTLIILLYILVISLDNTTLTTRATRATRAMLVTLRYASSSDESAFPPLAPAPASGLVL
jgi:hypothetical protein